MIPYLVADAAVILLLGLGSVSSRAVGRGRWGNAAAVPMLIVVCLVISVLPAMRASSVGTDTWMYMAMYERSVDSTSWDWTLYQSVTSFGFAGWQFAWKSFGLNTAAYLGVCAFLTNFMCLLGLTRISGGEKAARIVMLYVISSDYLFQYNGVRQALAVGMSVLGLAGIIQKRRMGYVLVLAAVAIHGTAIVSILGIATVKLGARRGASWVLLTCAAVGASLAVAMAVSPALGELVSSNLGEKYGGYLGEDTGNGTGRLLFFVMYLLILAVARRDASATAHVNVFILVCTAIVFLEVGLGSAVLNRLASYFTVWIPVILARHLSRRLTVSELAALMAYTGNYVGTLVYYGDLTPYLLAING